MISAAPVNIGDVVAGKYRIEHVLGAGGMGIVVAATHIYLDERVAIKFLLPEALKDATVVTRFLREAKVAAKLRTEHAARVHDVGTLGSGAPYLVMEYLEGNDLNAVVKSRGPLAADAAVELILQVCEAIADAHSIGIVHRDIKPANLFVTTRRDGTPAVKVIDFGISKVTKAIDAGAGITKTAEMRGSLLFIPPEQMASPRDVDPRSDIWSLGVTLYHLVTGSYPFVGDTMLELCAKILRSEPTAPRSIRPDLPEDLEIVILRCLRKAPSARFQDMAELAAALSRLAPAHARASVDRISRVLSLPAILLDGSEHRSAETISGGAMESSAQDGEVTRRRGVVPISVGNSEEATRMQPPRAQTQTEKSSWGSTNRTENRAATRGRIEGVTAGFLAGLLTSFAIAAGFLSLSRKSVIEAQEPAIASAVAHAAAAFLGADARSAPVNLEPPSPSAAITATTLAASASSVEPTRPPAPAATPAAWSPAVNTQAAPRKTRSAPASPSSKRRPEPF